MACFVTHEMIGMVLAVLQHVPVLQIAPHNPLRCCPVLPDQMHLSIGAVLTPMKHHEKISSVQTGYNEVTQHTSAAMSITLQLCPCSNDQAERAVRNTHA